MNADLTWLIAYDIREPNRLRGLHRYLRRQGLPCQYSVFLVEATAGQIVEILQDVKAIVDEKVDDVRMYHLTAMSRMWALGRQFSVEDEFLAHRMLMDLLGQGKEASVL